MINQKKRGRTFRKRHLRKLRKYQQHIVCAENSNFADTNYHNLLKWMGKEGFKFSKKLKPYPFPDTGRGLMTKKSVQCGDVIISIPENLLIKPDSVLKTYLRPFFEKYCPEATGIEILSLFLMCEKLKEKASCWHPYIITLPHTYDTPAFINSDILNILPLSLFQSATHQIKALEISYQKLTHLFISLETSVPKFKRCFTLDFYRWAYFTVNTRCVYANCHKRSCNDKNCSFHVALAPFLDLLNHSVDAQIEAGFNQKTKCYEIKSLSGFKKHSQAFIKYGNHGNRKLFLEYGFFLPSNINDIIPVSFDDISKVYENCFGQSLPAEKLVFAKQKGLLRNLGCCVDGLSWSLETFLKVLATENDLEYCKGIILCHHVLKESENIKFNMLVKGIISAKLHEYRYSSSKDELIFRQYYTAKHFKLISELLSLERSILLKILS